MKYLKRLATIAVWVLLIFSLSACGTENTSTPASSTTTSTSISKTTTSPAAVKKVNIALAVDQGSLDPALAVSTTIAHYAYAAMAPLVELKTDGTWHWLAATSCDVNTDATQYTFHINKNLKWSDGSDCTAQDFVNTVKRALNPKSGNGYASFLYVIKNAKEFRDGTADEKSIGVEATDSKTLKFTLNQPCVYFYHLLNIPVYWASPSKVATGLNGDWASDAKTSLTNGPFYLSEHVTGQYITLKKNPYYIEADKFKLDTLTFKVIPDPQSSVNAFKTGEVDITPGVSTSVDEYNGKPELKINPGMGSIYILMNWNVKPLDDTRVREALTLAINRADLTKAVGKGYNPSTNFVVPNLTSALGKVWSSETAPLFKEDIARAQSLLAQAGYPNGQGFPVLTYKFPGGAADQSTAEVLQAQLKKNLGINIQIQSQEAQVNRADRRAGSFDLCRMSWTADYCEPSTFLNMYISNSSYNDPKISIPDYDKLMSQASVEMNAANRNNLYHQAEAVLITKNFVLIPMYTKDQILLFSTKVSNVLSDTIRDPVRNGVRYQYVEVK